MRVATYNIEWFDALFGPNDELLADAAPAKRKGLTRRQQADAVAEVLRAVDPDLILITEAPNQGRRSGRSTVRALEGFAARYALRPTRALHGFPSPTHQEIALLYDPDRVAARADPLGEPLAETEALARPLVPDDPTRWGRPFPGAPRFDGACAWRLGEDAPQLAEFSRPPLEARITWRPGGREFRLLGVHLKSQRPRGDQTWEEVRARHLGQCVWLRARIDEHLSADEPVLLLGDLNQPPPDQAAPPPAFADRGRAALIAPPPNTPNAARRRLWTGHDEGGDRADTVTWTAPDGATGGERIDEILISAQFRTAKPRWRTWTPDSAPAVADLLRRASDHAPVSLDLDL